MMHQFDFYAVCHAKKDSLNNGIERIGRMNYDEKFDFNVNLLTSFSQIYKKLPDARISIPANRKKLMIDSGAYDFLIKEKGSFPYLPEDYFAYITDYHNRGIIDLDLLVSMDYICEPVKGNCLNKPNLVRIGKTIHNNEVLSRLFDKQKVDFQLVQVVQGYTPKEYEYSARTMIKKGLVHDGSYIGIGSLANRRHVSEIRDAVTIVSDAFADNGLKDVKIHLFGITLSAVKNKEIAGKIASFDSLSWTFPYRFGRVKLFTGSRMIEANTNKLLKEPEFYEVSLRTTLIYVDYLNYLYIHEKKKSVNEYLKKYISNWDIGSDVLADQINTKNYEARQNMILVYTGEKFTFLTPKGVELTDHELYFLARMYLLLFLNNLVTPGVDLEEKITRFVNVRDKKHLAPEIIQKNLIENVELLFDGFHKKIVTPAQIRDDLRQMESLIIPFLDYEKETAPKSQKTLDSFDKNQNKRRERIFDSIFSIDQFILSKMNKNAIV